jgi:hypothetical protein
MAPTSFIAGAFSSNSSMAKAPRLLSRAQVSAKNLKTLSSVFPHPVSLISSPLTWKAKPIVSQSTLQSCMHNLVRVQTTSPQLPSDMSIPRTIDPTACHSSLPICSSHPITYRRRMTLALHRQTSSSTRLRLCPYHPLEIWTLIFPL